MPLPSSAKPALAAAGMLALTLCGCSDVRDHKGYIIDSVLINTVAPGVDNRDSVQKTLGRPSFASEFDGGAEWYYVARDTKSFAFGNPKPVSQILLTVRFAKNGDVDSVQKTGLETVRGVSPYGRKTPTRGSHRGILSELFGNIAAGGGGTASAPTQDNPGT